MPATRSWSGNDRLGHSLKHLIENVNRLYKQGAGFASLQESLDTTTSGGKLVFHIFGALAEFERELIRERTKAGLKAARGQLGGRRPKLTGPAIAQARTLLRDPQTKVQDVCALLKVSRSTLYRVVGPQLLDKS